MHWKGLRRTVFSEEVFWGFSCLEEPGFIPLWQHSEMQDFISQFHGAILDFYVSFSFHSREVLVVKECPIKGEQVEIIRPACRFWKVLWISPCWFSSFAFSAFQHLGCNFLEHLWVPGGQEFQLGTAGVGSLHPGVHSQAEILMWMDSHPHHGQVCGETGPMEISGFVHPIHCAPLTKGLLWFV